MKFSIITPTYKRPDLLKRTIQSVIAQSEPHFELIIINDNPGDTTKDIVASFADNRIIYLENTQNVGVNATRNRGLDQIADDSAWVIFLDDDDYLAPAALATITNIIANTKQTWIVTDRGTSENVATTTAPTSATTYSYTLDYLIRRRFRGDATHCIASSYINSTTARLRFPTQIRQAEEWLFYSHLGTYTRFYYTHVVTTLTDGYVATGLNLRRRTTGEQLRTIPKIMREGRQRGMVSSPTFLIYVIIRIIRAFIK